MQKKAEEEAALAKRQQEERIAAEKRAAEERARREVRAKHQAAAQADKKAEEEALAERQQEERIAAERREAEERARREAEAKRQAAEAATMKAEEEVRVNAAEQEKIASLPQEPKVELPERPVNDPTALARSLQTELKRVGCDPGVIDGKWGTDARDALRRFIRFAKIDLQSEEPSDAALNALTKQMSRVCPETSDTKAKRKQVTHVSHPDRSLRPKRWRAGNYAGIWVWCSRVRALALTTDINPGNQLGGPYLIAKGSSLDGDDERKARRD